MGSPDFARVFLPIAIATASLTTSLPAHSQGRSAEDVLKGYIITQGVDAAINLYGFGQTMESCVESAATTSSQSVYARSVNEVKEGFDNQYKKGWVFGQSAAWAIVGNEVAAYIAAHPNSRSRMCQFMSDIGLQANGAAAAKIGCSGSPQSGTVLSQSGGAGDEQNQNGVGAGSGSASTQAGAGAPEPDNEPHNFTRPNKAQVGDRVDLSKFNTRIRGSSDQMDTESGYRISPDRAGDRSHGGSVYKLLNRQGQRVATLDGDGNVLRMP